MQAGVTGTAFANYTPWKWQPEKKNHYLAPELTAYALTRSFSHASHQCGRDSPSPIAVCTVKGGPQYCDHLRPTPEGSVWWCAQRAASMCMCMSPRARWMIVHRSYLSMVLSLSVMQAGVTCTAFANYTVWKWKPEKKNHDLVPELVAYALMWSFSHTSHQCGRDSLSPSPFSGCHFQAV